MHCPEVVLSDSGPKGVLSKRGVEDAYWPRFFFVVMDACTSFSRGVDSVDLDQAKETVKKTKQHVAH